MLPVFIVRAQVRRSACPARPAPSAGHKSIRALRNFLIPVSLASEKRNEKLALPAVCAIVLRLSIYSLALVYRQGLS